MNAPVNHADIYGVPPRMRNWLTLVVFGAIIALVVIPYDATLSSILQIEKLRGDMRKFINLLEFFGHGAGFFVIMTGLFVAFPERWREYLRCLAGFLIAGLLVNLLKMILVRKRPWEFWPELSPENDSSISFFLTEAGGWSLNHNDHLQSFPSGHSASAMVLAMGLSMLFPRGRWYFLLIGALSCSQRVFSHAHWPSDVFAGGILGLGAGLIAWNYPLPVRQGKLAEKKGVVDGSRISPLD